MQQRWRDALFLHWPYPPDVVARHLPPGFTVDRFAGTAWVGLTPFRVAACSVGLLPPVGLWSFPETNLRTYVVGPDGRDGIWFLSIEAGDLAVTVGARLGIGAPYHASDMSVGRDGTASTPQPQPQPDPGRGPGLVVRYRSRRRSHGDAGHDIRIRVGERVPDDERAGLVDWLTGRWRSWTTWAGVPLWSPVQHQAWPLRHAEIEAVDESLTAAVDLPPPAGEPLVHYSPGVDARLGPARPALLR